MVGHGGREILLPIVKGISGEIEGRNIGGGICVERLSEKCSPTTGEGERHGR